MMIRAAPISNLQHKKVRLLHAALLPVLLMCACPAGGADWIIEGASRKLEQNLLLHLGDIDQINATSTLTSELSASITRGAQALGFYHLQWRATREKNGNIRIVVEPGERVRWRNIDASISGDGSDEEFLQTLWADLPMETGRVLNHGTYEAFKQRVMDALRAEGYLDAKFTTRQVLVDTEAYSADLTLHLDTGPAFLVRNVDFEGSGLDEGLLHAMSALKRGDRFRASALAEFYGALFDSGYFQEIDIEQRPAAERERDIHVSLVDAARHRVTAGAGFSTDTGARVRLGWTRPSINRAGHQLQNEIRLAELEQAVTSEYRIPLGNPLEHYIGVNAGWRNRDVEDTRTEIFNAGVALHNKRPSGWHSRYGIDIEQEKYRQGSEPAEEVFYTIPGVGWDYVYQEGPVRLPDYGYKFWINADGSVPALGADTPFARVMLGGKWLRVWRDRHELQLRAEAGAISQSDIAKVPASRRFFTGGDQTVRGFSYLALSPRDDAGEAIGGRFVNVASIEYRYRLRDDWHLSTFVDSGRAYTDQADPFHTGVGIGLHWQTVVGPIRFDIARPVNDDKYKAVHLHITMGPSL